MDFSDLRQEYLNFSLRSEDLSDNPFDLFRAWLHQAIDLKVPEPNAMSLATHTSTSISLRSVLLKGIDSDGLIFFTDYQSRKGRDLASHPQAALLFHWKELQRQVSIEGHVEKVPREITERYFATRPRASQITTHILTQSEPIASRHALEEAFQALQHHYEGHPIPPPEHWGGYKLLPTRFEFWQGRPFRLHDRFQYTLSEDQWKIERLVP